MTIPNLIPTDPTADAEATRFSYEAAVLTVSGASKYNPNEQVGFKEVPGFWKLPMSMINAERVPPQGSIVVAQLTTKPKPPGPNTRAGSKYQDIDFIKPAPEGSVPIASQQQSDSGWDSPPPTQAPREEWSGNGETTSGDTGLTVDEKIKKSQAANLLFQAIEFGADDLRIKMGYESQTDMYSDAADAYLALKAGKTPFTTQPEPAAQRTEDVDCAHDGNVVGVNPPQGGFKPGDFTMWCNDCNTGIGVVNDNNGDPADDGFGAPEKLDW